MTPPDATDDATRIFDTTIVLAPDGELLTVYDKTHLFDREKTVFTPGAALEPPFVWGGVRFGVLCCFDIELPEPARTLALRGAQCLLVPSANMEPWGEHHRAYVRSRALENHAFVAYANAVGAASGYVFEGGSCLVDPLGRVLCDAGRDETVVWADLDPAVADESRVSGTTSASGGRSCTTDAGVGAGRRTGAASRRRRTGGGGCVSRAGAAGQPAGVKRATSGSGSIVHEPLTPSCCAPSSTCRRAIPKSMGAVQ